MDLVGERLLIVDDNRDILFSLELLLRKRFKAIDCLVDPQMIEEYMGRYEYDLIMLDMNFSKESDSGDEGFHYLKQILEKDSTSSVILITAYGDIDKAVKAIKFGASDFIVKPWDNQKLIGTIISSVKLKHSRVENRELKLKQDLLTTEINNPYKKIIGNSPKLKSIFKTIDKVSKTDASFLILGENGTGKELIARALHNNSDRSKKPFISVDLGSITETLFETELFGHIKGAFTNANRDRSGRFVAADGGTIFLDEIGNLSLPLQAKLLSVLEKREIVPVGSDKPIKVDFRVVSATNRDLYRMVVDGEFREDLLYRINTVEVNLPKLIERGSDIELLANYFLEIYSKKYRKSINRLSSSGLEKLKSYSWPGNIRELRHAIERGVIMGGGGELNSDDFSFKSETVVEVDNDSNKLEDMERVQIIKSMKKFNGNISKAAKDLGLTRSSLYRRLEKYGI